MEKITIELPLLCTDAILGYIELKELRNPDSLIRQLWPDEYEWELQRRERAARQVITEFLTRGYSDGNWLIECSGKLDTYKTAIDTIFDYKSLAMETWTQLCSSGTNSWAKLEHLNYAIKELPDAVCAPKIYNKSGRNYHFIFVLLSYIYH